jgi:hypothetical protein
VWTKKSILEIAGSNKIKLGFIRTPPRKWKYCQEEEHQQQGEVIEINETPEISQSPPPRPKTTPQTFPFAASLSGTTNPPLLPPVVAPPQQVPAPALAAAPPKPAPLQQQVPAPALAAAPPKPAPLQAGAPVKMVPNAHSVLMQKSTRAAMNRTRSCSGIMLDKILLDMRPIKWGPSISKNKMPSYIRGDNEEKCLHTLSLVNAFATDEQKQILSSTDAPRIDAKNASNEAVQLCMQELLDLEVATGIKKEGSSRLKATVLGVGMRYQKYLKVVEANRLEERKKARMARDLG